MTSQDDFAVRFAKHKDELEWLFMELYHNREGLEVLEREMAEAYNARSAELEGAGQGAACRPGLVQAWQYVRHDHQVRF